MNACHGNRRYAPQMAARFEDGRGWVSQVIEKLERHHLVSLVGVPGAGKSALGHAVIRELGAERFGEWVPTERPPHSDFLFVDDVDRLSTSDSKRFAAAVATGEARWLVTSRYRLGLGSEASLVVGPLEDDAVRLLHTFLERRGCSTPLAHCRAVVDVIDALPGQLFAAARFVELHGVQYVLEHWDTLDPLAAALGDAVTHAVPEGLAGAACFVDKFDAATFVAVTGSRSEALAELVDRGYVQRLDGVPPDFRVLRSVRRVAPEPASQVRGRHFEWVVANGTRVDLLELVHRRHRSAVSDELFAAAVERLCTGPLPPTVVVDEAIEVADGDRRAALLSARARIALRDGDPLAAQDYCEAASKHVESEPSQVVVHSLRAAIARIVAGPGEALREYEDALALGPVSEDVLLEHAATLWESGEHSAARQATREALERARAAGDLRREGVVTSNLGVMAHHAGDLGEARAHHEAARALHVEAGNRRFEAIAEFDLGTLDHELGVVRRALRHYARAIDLFAEVGDRRLGELACAACEAARAQLGEPAVWSIDKIERDFATVGDAIFTEAAALYRQVVAALARTTVVPFDCSSYRRRPDEVQLPARLLADLTSARVDGRLLVVAGEMDRFRLGDAEVDLGARTALRNTLRLLVERRLESGTAVSLDDVITHGWPDEKVTAEAAKNRAHVALSTLRRLGLRDVLQTVDDGYLLVAPVCLVQASTGPTAASS